MKKYLLSLLSLFIACIAVAQPSSIVLSEKVKITFPGPIDSSSSFSQMGAKVYSYSVKDSSLNYSALSMDLSPMGLQAEMVSSMGDAIWDQIKTGMLQQMGNVDLKKDEIIQFKGKSCLKLELDISKLVSDELKGKTIYNISFFSGSVLHQLSLMVKTTDNKQKEADEFFNSLVIEQ